MGSLFSRITFMLKKSYRLKNNYAFIATYNQKKIVADEFFTMHIGKEKFDLNSFTKYGFVVSKKIHKRAVKRNRLKRLMRESSRELIKNGTFDCFSKYMSVVITSKPDALSLTFSEMKNSFLNLAEKTALKY